MLMLHQVQQRNSPMTPSVFAKQGVRVISYHKFGTLVDKSRWINECSGNGEWHILFKNAKSNRKEITNDDVLYMWICKSNFIGNIWNECREGFYGPNCLPCPRNPADDEVCGTFGICDDGIRGSGVWFWEDPELQPELFCESASRETLHQEEVDFTWGFFLLIIVAFMSLLLLYLYIKIPCLEKFPECIAAVVLGIWIGTYLKYHYSVSNDEGFLKILQFEPHAYFLFLLPPIMFQVGFSMNASTFFRNILTINSYAIFGTFISSFMFSFIFYVSLPFVGVQYSYLDCFQCGCIICAIDPVATISIFKSLKINDRIYMILFGESTLNNAVAIALATSVEGIKVIMKSNDEAEVLDIAVFTIEKFWTYFFLSFIIGAVWAVLISFFFAILNMEDMTSIEIAFFILSWYFPYIFWEAVGCSGVISIFVAGSVMRNYAFYSLGQNGKITIEYLVDTVGYTTENFVFAYLGLSIPLTLKEVNYPLIAVGIVSMMIARTVAIIFASSLVQWFDSKKVPFSHQVIFIYAGLRGAVAFYLGLNFLSYEKSTLLPTVISIILFSVIGLGSTTIFVIGFLDRWFPNDQIYKEILIDDPFNDDYSVKLEDRDYENNNKEERSKSLGLISRIENFDRDFLQRLLRKEGWEEDDPYLNEDFGRQYQDYDNSLEDRISAIIKNTNNMDLSPYRNSIMHKKNIPHQVNEQVIAQMSMRHNLSRRFDKDEPFVTPNKGLERHSINYRQSEMSSFRGINFLQVAQIMQDDNINFSASRRKSVRAFSNRKSKDGSRSDLSYPRNREENKTIGGPRSGTFSPGNSLAIRQEDRRREKIKRLNEDGSMPFRYRDKAVEEREEKKEEKLSAKDDDIVLEENVVVEVAEADEEEQNHSESIRDSKHISENNPKQDEEFNRKRAGGNINVGSL